MRLDIHPAGTALDAWPMPYPFVVVPGGAAPAALRALQLQASQDGASAVLWGDRAEAARLFEQWDDPAGATRSAEIEAVLAASAGRGIDHLDQYRKSVDDALAATLRKHRRTASEDEHGPPIDADGPLPIPHTAPIGLVDHRTGALKPEVLLGVLPTAHPHEAPAYHLFGGRNRCPPAAVHVGLGRDWAARYGARLILNTPDAIEYEIARPVDTREDALALAWVHYRYCPDLVEQLVGSIEALAAMLKGGRYWYFWWD